MEISHLHFTNDIILFLSNDFGLVKNALKLIYI